MMIGAGTICYICIYTHIIHMYTYVIYTCYSLADKHIPLYYIIIRLKAI